LVCFIWVIWVRNDDRRVSTEGEADFVIIGPEIGLVVIEVKGGGISREGDYWYTTDRNNIKHPIKNPILQAITCKHNFVSYLKSNEFFHGDSSKQHTWYVTQMYL
jgi:hypothetical protein